MSLSNDRGETIEENPRAGGISINPGELEYAGIYTVEESVGSYGWQRNSTGRVVVVAEDGELFSVHPEKLQGVEEKLEREELVELEDRYRVRSNWIPDEVKKITSNE